MVYGSVQGVGFRWATQGEASRLDVAGYVRNLWDGTVEAELEGDEPAVAAMIEWLRQGPRNARVRGIEVSSVPIKGEVGFRVTG